MRVSRDVLIVVALFVLLIALTLFSGARRAEIEQQQSLALAYSSRSALPIGTLALYRWLETVGYRSVRIEGDRFAVPSEARALFVFTPREEFRESDAAAVLRWVERGNTLVMLDNVLSSERNGLLRALKAQRESIAYAPSADLQQPLAAGQVRVQTSAALDLQRDDYVPYLSASGRPLLVGLPHGKGFVYLGSAPFLLANDALDDDDNAALALALLSAVPRGSTVAFDDFHLGGARGNDSLQALLYNTPWGWSLIYAFIVVFAYLFINGQRFGRVVPLPSEIARRSPAEYVHSLAQLFRRAGKRQMVLNHYRQQLKRSLGRPYRINANLPDAEFVAELARHRELDQQALLQTLRALNQPHVGERALVKLADEAIKLRKRTDS